MAQRGAILIADITGYTVYLSRSELEHAQGTLTDLLELLVDHTRPPFVISALEGDAVFSYALEDDLVSGQTFLESIEDTYVAFRRAIELMILNNTCRCNACANVAALDLKFFVHHGEFVVQRVGEEHQLVGTDINLIHRLLKNSVTAETGMRAYVLCTEAAKDALGIEDATDMVEHREPVPDLGEITVWIKDMHPVYEARKEIEQLTFSPEEVGGSVATEISMPPELVWDYLNHSEFRNILLGSDRYEVVDRRSGRVGEGSTFQCYHGSKVVSQLVLEWRPFERIVLQQLLPLWGGPTQVTMDFQLTSTETGTRLSQTVTKPTGPSPQRSLVRVMMAMTWKRAQKDIDDFRDQIEADRAARESSELPINPVSLEQVRSQAAASLGDD